MKQKDNKTPGSVQYVSYDDNKIPVNNPILNYIYNHTEFKLGNLFPYGFSLLLGLVLSTGKPWWLLKFDLKSKYIGIAFLLFGILILILAIIMIGYLIYFRSVKKLNMLSVEMKEIVRHIFKECFGTKKHKAKEEIINTVCRKIISYFRILKRSNNTDKVGAAIRLAVCDKSNKIEFKTYTRSNLNSGRELTSQGIPADQGIPNYFSIKNGSGFLVFNN